jgi:hypothetical protein
VTFSVTFSVALDWDARRSGRRGALNNSNQVREPVVANAGAGGVYWCFEKFVAEESMVGVDGKSDYFF